MGQTTDGVRSPFVRVLGCTIGISYFSSFIHAEAIRVQLNWAGATLVFISCHLAQADCSQFDSDTPLLCAEVGTVRYVAVP